MKKIDIDSVKKLGSQPFSKESNSHYIFLLSLERYKLANNYSDADFKEYLDLWKAFAYSYYFIGKRALHIPLELKDNPSKFKLITYRNNYNIYERLKEERPTTSKDWFSRVYYGFLNFLLGNLSGACENFYESLEFDDHCAEIWSFIGCANFEKTEITDAINAFERSVSIDPQFYGNYLLLIDCFKQLELYESVIEVTKKGLLQFPEDWCLLIERAKASNKLGNGEYFLEMTEKAIRNLSKKRERSLKKKKQKDENK